MPAPAGPAADGCCRRCRNRRGHPYGKRHLQGTQYREGGRHQRTLRNRAPSWMEPHHQRRRLQGPHHSCEGTYQGAHED